MIGQHCTVLLFYVDYPSVTPGLGVCDVSLEARVPISVGIPIAYFPHLEKSCKL